MSDPNVRKKDLKLAQFKLNLQTLLNFPKIETNSYVGNRGSNPHIYKNPKDL